MSCCTTLAPPEQSLGQLDRRTALAGLAGAITLAGRAHAQGLTRLRLAFCGQLLCVVPYEVTRARGHFRAEGLEVELVYTRGGNQAMQALVGGAVDYAGTSFDVALQAFANGAPIRRFASTGRLPLFALAAAPARAGTIRDIAALDGRTIGISALGNADHVLALFLMKRAGLDPGRARFAALGTNLYEALRRGQVEAAMVQEPALTLVQEAGGHVIFNAMDIADATRVLGGAFEFMGVAVRASERDRRLDEMRRLARALAAGLRDTRTIPVEEVVAALPRELIAGGDWGRLGVILERYRESLYPDEVRIDPEAAARVARAQREAGVLTREVDLAVLLDRAVLEG
ncbi:ABC transporter substrate-binding protein [Elioraea sp. Yellowstone]|jgi:NitT/TauT family transport system substrate-binding protein|uniref:ABC transporter substrate-binding protein n=1 Tax=Elioraea sp. Yellowstone TaxID=2592070 RepID=UPI00115233B7|nr:ABC transporter substrate-binding protein [Elioraea sp. Yellowstone]TQF81819.1 ABC transporter substrate-binding protein [Elioraea sp. Yellowstone]